MVEAGCREYSIIKVPNPKTEKVEERTELRCGYSVLGRSKRHQSRSELKRRVHLLSVAVSSQLIQH